MDVTQDEFNAHMPTFSSVVEVLSKGTVFDHAGPRQSWLNNRDERKFSPMQVVAPLTVGVLDMAATMRRGDGDEARIMAGVIFSAAREMERRLTTGTEEELVQLSRVLSMVEVLFG